MFDLRRAVAPIALALGVVVAGILATPLWGVTWGPVTAYYDGTARARGNGNFTNQNPYANNAFTLKDMQNDGNTVYGKTTFWYYKKGYWTQDETKSTPEIINTTQTFNLRDQLDPAGSKARAESWVCVQLGFPVPDACSPHALATFSY